MKKQLIIIAGISGFLAVALGAFGAHGLKNLLSGSMLETYKTGVLYHLIHSAVLAAIALSAADKLKKSFYFFAAGIILFSFSLYLYTITGISWLAMVTPFGGVSFLIGWIFLIVEGVKKDNIP